MKFTMGYLLGAATIVGFMGSFAAGAIVMDVLNDKKKEAVTKLEDTTISSTVRDIMNSRKN